jgi:uncharacterized protein
METNYPPTTPPGKNAANRILLVDILRGFALFGIIINHIAMSFLAGPPPGGVPFNIFSPIDQAFDTTSMYLTFGKFFTIFSFLFGLSFAIQIEGSQKKGASFNLRFLWRLLILFAIGYIHNMFFSGDILVIYAILGLMLLPARLLPNKVLLPLALLLILNTPNLVHEVIGLNAPPPTPAQLEAQKNGYENFVKMSTEQYRIKQTGSLVEVMRMNAISGMIGKYQFQVMSGRIWITLGLFLLGLYAGRKKIFEHTAANLLFFKKLFIAAGIAAVLSTILATLYGNPFGGASSLLGVIGNFSFSIHQASLSAFYVAGIVLLYWQTKFRGRLNILAPVGQMGLTTYLMQSVFGLIVFYGFGMGLMGHIGVAGCIALGIGFFIVQVLFANYWMARYRYGAVEWLWRSLTFLKVQPMRKIAHNPVATV